MASEVQAATRVVQASVVRVFWTAGYRPEILPWEAQLELLLVEDDDVSAELMEAPVQGEEAPEEVVEALSAMNQKNLT